MAKTVQGWMHIKSTRDKGEAQSMRHTQCGRIKKNRFVREQNRRRTGAALVELALIMPVLLLLVVGLLDLGRGFSQAGVVVNAARQGARYGAAKPDNASDTSTIIARVLEEAEGSGVKLTSSDVQVVAPLTTTGQPLSVKIDYSYRPLLGKLIGLSTFHIRRECTMMIL